LGLHVESLEVRAPSELESGLESASSKRIGALIVRRR
jgi:hypothetical protein